MDSYWLIQTNNDSVTVFTDPGPSGPIGRDVTVISPSRLVDPNRPGLDDDQHGDWPVGDISGWMDTVIRGVVLSNRGDTTLGGRPSAQFEVQLTDDVNWGDGGRRRRSDGSHRERRDTEHSFLERAEELLGTLAFGPSAIDPTA